jgi:hypothetical protein
MAGVVYILCSATAFACGCLLLRAYFARKDLLLFWSAVCFAMLTLNNLMLVADRLLFPDVDLSTWRLLPALAAMVVLLHGLIWHGEWGLFMSQMLLGAIGMASVMAGMFFARSWRTTHDPFYLLFAASFWLQGAERFLIGSYGTWAEGEPRVYMLRLAAYMLIVVAIAGKNRRTPGKR